jgi:hypothetical protein
MKLTGGSITLAQSVTLDYLEAGQFVSLSTGTLLFTRYFCDFPHCLKGTCRDGTLN